MCVVTTCREMVR